MGIWVPSGSNAYSWSAGSHTTTRPAAAFGASVTPGNNTKGSWVQLMSGAAVARDVFAIRLNINSANVSAAARDLLVDVGVDPAGGTSYSVLIPDLLASCASPYNIGSGGVNYIFPIWIRAGSSIAVRGSVNNATVGTFRASCRVYGSPHDRTRIKVGTYVEAIGVTGASSSGTTITSGTTSEGAWTSLGSMTRKSWWYQVGFGVNDSTMSALAYHVDLAVGDGTNKDIVIENALISTTTGERLNNAQASFGSGKPAPAGTAMYARVQCSGAADSNLSVAAYALGG